MDEHITSKTSLVIWSLVIFESVSVIKTYFMNQTIQKSHGHDKFKSSQSGLLIYHSAPSPPSNLNPPVYFRFSYIVHIHLALQTRSFRSVILCFNGLTKRKKIIPSGNFCAKSYLGFASQFNFIFIQSYTKRRLLAAWQAEKHELRETQQYY